MILPGTFQVDSTGGEIVAIVEGYTAEQSAGVQNVWLSLLRGRASSGSVGVAFQARELSQCSQPRVGTSPTVFDSRPSPGLVALREAPCTAERAVMREVMALPVATQAREAMAALSLNKSQLADVLGVSRPTLYEWLDGKEPNASNSQRLTTLVHLLASAGVTSSNSISPRFLRLVVSESGKSLLEALSAEAIDEQLISSLLREAKSLTGQSQSRRVSREERLRGLGFEDPSVEQRREQLGRNVAQQEWPKG